MQPKFFLAAFGDTVKFREWEDRYLVSSWESWKFVEKLYREFTRFRNGTVYLKPLADGFMAVKELAKNPATQKNQAINFLRRCCKVARAVNNLITELPGPQLRGFRIRVVAGYGGRLEIVQSKNTGMRQVDYTGKPVSLAFSLLAVEPQYSCVCDHSVKTLLDLGGRSSGEVTFQRLKRPKGLSKVIRRRDARILWSFCIPRRKRKCVNCGLLNQCPA